MTKRRLFYILSAVCFVLMLTMTLAVIGDINASLDAISENESSDSSDGWARFGTALALSIALVLFYGYAIILAIPALIKIIQAIVMKKALGIVGIVLDAVFICFDAILLVNSIIDDGFKLDITLLWLIAVLALPAMALSFDIIALKQKNKLKDGEQV